MLFVLFYRIFSVPPSNPDSLLPVIFLPQINQEKPPMLTRLILQGGAGAMVERDLSFHLL